MDLHKLRTFVTVAREGNLTKAADLLCLSQPAVSAQLKGLEDALGLKLFERLSRGMELTKAGSILVEEAESALCAARRLSSQAKLIREGTAGKLRIGIIDAPAALQIGRTVSILQSQHPNLKISLTQGISWEIVEWLSEGKVEAGYVLGPPTHPDIAAMQVAPIRLRIVAPPDWAPRIRSMDWKGIASLPWISTPAKCPLTALTQRMFSDHGVRPRTMVEADQENTLLNLVSCGIGLTLLREDVAEAARRAGQVAIWEHGAGSTHLYFIHRHDETIDAGLLSALKSMLEICRNHGTTN